MDWCSVKFHDAVTREARRVDTCHHMAMVDQDTYSRLLDATARMVLDHVEENAEPPAKIIQAIRDITVAMNTWRVEAARARGHAARWLQHDTITDEEAARLGPQIVPFPGAKPGAGDPE